MKSPLETGTWLEFEEVLSTQDAAASHIRVNDQGGVFFAHHQTLGRGRFGREWISEPGESLTMSLAFWQYADHPKPYLIGMAVACAAAAVIECELKWPNDLIFGDHKVGGILTEMSLAEDGRRVPIVGVGINLNNGPFPEELRARATSVRLYKGGRRDPLDMAKKIVHQLQTLPEPDNWSAIKPIWDLYDYTAGRKYQLPNGEVGTAVGMGHEGQLIAMVEGEIRELYAAEAHFGAEQSA